MISDDEIDRVSEFALSNSHDDLADFGKFALKNLPKIIERLTSAETALKFYAEIKYDGEWAPITTKARAHFESLEE